MKTIICKHCNKDIGEFLSELETHLWVEHREIMVKFLNKQCKKS